MSDRETPRRRHPRRLQRPAAHRVGVADRVEPAATAGNATAAETTAVAGIVTEPERSGEDVRRRGWFWHWNSIVTQYAPLIGLKGVGLLNSYTVWTDRREASPHRGYAFPSQQREADFYGEDRAELITINKILVALDLIEIRKEMVVRPDEQGRRWRVPHNFYRVKDHPDGFSLTTRDVLKVVELAGRDKAVYRYIRRIFSPKFAPIDPANTWHQMLPELRATETWQRLAARAAREEDRASARSRAGHASRRGSLTVPTAGDTATPNDTSIDSGSDESTRGGTTSVATTNKGFALDVDPSNEGSTIDRATSVAAPNRARATGVAPANTMYHQSDLTTTTDESEQNQRDKHTAETVTSMLADAGQGELRQRDESAGPAGQTAPENAPAELMALRAYEEANDRPATPAERRLLRELAARFEPVARAAAIPGETSGWAWLTAAIYEAVAAGSAFVAPRRLREILNRWERDGRPDVDADVSAADPLIEIEEERPRVPGGRSSERPRGRDLLLGEAPDIPLPHGFGSRQTWSFTVSLLAGAIERSRLAELIGGTAITGYRDGVVTIASLDARQAARLAGEYRELIERKLGEAMRRPVRLTVAGPDIGQGLLTDALDGIDDAEHGGEEEQELAMRSFVVAECGMPSGQVWAAVLQELQRAPEVGRANFESWLRTTQLVGRDRATGALIVGVPHGLAQRRVSSRFAAPLGAAVARVIGSSVPIEIVITDDWLRQGQSPPDAAPATGTGG